MKDCSLQLSASFEDGGHDEKKKQIRCRSPYGAVDEIREIIRRIGKDPQTKGLKSLTIQLTVK